MSRETDQVSFLETLSVCLQSRDSNMFSEDRVFAYPINPNEILGSKTLIRPVVRYRAQLEL